MAHPKFLVLCAAFLAACTAPGGASRESGSRSSGDAGLRPSRSGPSTSDSRVRSFLGRVPPEFSADARWLNAPPTTLAGLRGRTVFLQFAFPT